MIDELLSSLGLKYDELLPDERETLHVMLERTRQNTLTVDSIRESIQRMKYAVEEELTKHDLPPKQDLFLKARLRNLMLLEAFLLSPEKAEKELKRALGGMLPRNRA